MDPRTRHVVICLAMLAVLLGAAPRTVEAPASAAADPERYEVVSGDYTVTGLRIDGFPARVPVTGHYVVPEGAEGPRPFALFLHGKHTTCYRSSDGAEFSSWPCPQTADPIPSHLGYRYLQRTLAQRGYVTVSVMANGVDGQEDFYASDAGVAARSALVRRHLRLWEDWTTGERPGPDGTDWTGRVDLDRTLLVGHSRGGEGVVRAAVDTLPGDGWRVRGLVLLAPSNNTRQVAPRVPTTVLMGYCDGDLNFWPGQGYFDVARDVVPDPALRSAVSLTGANHAYFNTEWSPRTREHAGRRRRGELLRRRPPALRQERPDPAQRGGAARGDGDVPDRGGGGVRRGRHHPAAAVRRPAGQASRRWRVRTCPSARSAATGSWSVPGSTRPCRAPRGPPRGCAAGTPRTTRRRRADAA